MKGDHHEPEASYGDPVARAGQRPWRSRPTRAPDDLHASDQLWLASQARPAPRVRTLPRPHLTSAALAEADLADHPDRRPLLRGRSRRGTRHPPPPSLVDNPCAEAPYRRAQPGGRRPGSRVHGVYTARHARARCAENSPHSIPLPDLHAQDAPDIALVSAERAFAASHSSDGRRHASPAHHAGSTPTRSGRS